MPRYEFAEGGSNKFWEITLEGTSFKTTYGKIGAAGQTTVKSFKSEADAKKEADMFNPKNAKVDTLPDGWVLTFDNEGSMGKNFFVQVRRDIGGKAIWCETTVAMPEQQTNALNFCKSLKK